MDRLRLNLRTVTLSLLMCDLHNVVLGRLSFQLVYNCDLYHTISYKTIVIFHFQLDFDISRRKCEWYHNAGLL